jgi:hypothetical protein
MLDSYLLCRTLFDRSASYRILLQGRLDASWSEQLEGMNLICIDRPGQGPITMLAGPLLDQAALHGVLQCTYHLGLTILLVERTADQIPAQIPAQIPDQGASSHEHID